MCLPRVCNGALASTFFRCHTESHHQKVAVFSSKMTFKDHIFIGEKPFFLPPSGSAALCTHTLFYSLLRVLNPFKVWFRSCPGSMLEEAPKITWCIFWLSDGVQPSSVERPSLSGLQYSTSLVSQNTSQSICESPKLSSPSQAFSIVPDMTGFPASDSISFSSSHLWYILTHSQFESPAFSIKYLASKLDGDSPIWPWRIVSAEPQQRTGSQSVLNFILIQPKFKEESVLSLLAILVYVQPKSHCFSWRGEVEYIPLISILPPLS